MALILNKGKYFTKGQAVLLADDLLLTKTAYGPEQKIPAHLHQDAYLSVVIDGDYHEIGEGFDDQVEPGTTIYHPGREIHENAIGPKGALLLNFEIPDSFWEKKGILDLRPKGRALNADPRFLDYATRISDELADPKRLGLMGVEGLSLQLLDLFLKLNNRPESGIDVLDKVDGYILESFAKPLTIEQLAKEFDVAPGWLARKFKQHFGETIGDRIVRVRLNAAIRLLNNTTKTLAEVAVASGFFDQSHFTKTFKKKRGVSPGQYRKMIAKK